MASTRTPEYQEFLKRLKSARKSRITQIKLAKKLGVPQSYVSKYENGERRLDVVEYLKVARAIGIEPMSVLDGLPTETDAKPPKRILRKRLLTARMRR